MTVQPISGVGWGTDTYRAVFFPIATTGAIDAPGYPVAAEEPYLGLEFAGPKNLALNLGTPRAINNVSQGRVNDTIYLPSTDAKTAEFHLSYIDQVTFAALSRVKVRTIGGGQGFAFGTNKQGLEIAGTFLISQLAFHDDDAVTQWNNYIMPRARAIVTMPGFTDAETDVTVNLSLSSSKKHVWGETLTEALDGATQMLVYNHITWDIFNIAAWMADGSEDTFQLPDAHPSADSRADTLLVYDYTTGSALTVSSSSATQVVLSSAPTAGHPLIGIYEASA
jgi:hypothetical protein